MEPFRPAVDRAVIGSIHKSGEDKTAELALDPNRKRLLVGAITNRYWVDGEERTLLDIVQITCQRLAAVIVGEMDTLEIPAWRTEVRKRAGRALSDHVDVRDVRSAG